MTCVLKEGTVYTVFIDPISQQPTPFTDPKSPPSCSFPMTYVGLNDLQNAYPGHQFNFISETKPPPPEPAPLTPEQQAKIDAAYKAICKGEEQPTPPPPTLTTPSAQQTGALQRAQEFLKRLELAKQYASKKNLPRLDMEISIVQALIKEVWQ